MRCNVFMQYTLKRRYKECFRNDSETKNGVTGGEVNIDYLSKAEVSNFGAEKYP